MLNPNHDHHHTTSIQCTTAMFPGQTFAQSLLSIANIVKERTELSMDWIQLCPQSFGVVDEGLIERLRQSHPHTQFQLHSNVRIDCGKRPVHGSSQGEWVHTYLQEFERLTLLSGCGIYSLHAGYKDECNLQKMFDNIRTWNEQYRIIIAVEGLYPERKRKALLSTWMEYEQLLNANIPYAIDLSHLNIVAHAENDRPIELIQTLLQSPHCREVHLSSNNGRIDSHRPWSRQRKEWWWPLLSYKHRDCVVFCEENLRSNPLPNHHRNLE